MNVIRLEGCTAEPLGSYLKALAVLRLMAEQADPEARGWWDQTCFCLETELNADALLEFFLNRYAPTPVLSPWNGGSGFYPKDRKIGIEAIAKSEHGRFAEYRAAIKAAKNIAGVGDEKGKSPAEEDERRRNIQLECRNRLPEGCVEWLDAAVGIGTDDKRTFAPILGTGGNEGRLDYTNNFMEYLADLLIQPDKKTPVKALLRNALFGTATSGLQSGSVGQYDPGRAGGFNQGQGVTTGDVPLNPWNFVLALEGGVAWAAGLYRRQGVSYRSFLCSPFTVWATPVGYGSAAAKDRDSARAEVWTPIWERPASYREIRALLREGRASADGKPAQNGLEFAEAACMLGVDRGISGFMRYSLLKRRGDSYVALPAGRFGVRDDRWQADLVRELNAVMDEMDGRMKSPAAEYTSLRRQVDEAVYNLLLRGEDAALADVAASVGRLYRRFLVTEKPVWTRLSGDWVTSTASGAEAGIAASLAGMWDREIGGFSIHLDRGSGKFSWTGSNLEERMASTLERRLLAGDQEGMTRNALGSRYRASLEDVTRFLEASLDDERIEDLLFGFLLVDWQKGVTPPEKRRGEVGVWPVYALLKQLFRAEQVEMGSEMKYVPGDMRVLSALRADDVRTAAQFASRRLQNAGMAHAEMQDAGGFPGMRLAAALLIPVWYGPAMQQLFQDKTEERQ